MAIALKTDINIDPNEIGAYAPNIYFFMSGNGMINFNTPRLPQTLWIFAPEATMKYSSPAWVGIKYDGTKPKEVTSQPGQFQENYYTLIGCITINSFNGSGTDLVIYFTGAPLGGGETFDDKVYRTINSNFYINEVPDRYSDTTKIYDIDGVTILEDHDVNGDGIPDVKLYINLGTATEQLVSLGTPGAEPKYHPVANEYYKCDPLNGYSSKRIYAEYGTDVSGYIYAHNEWLSTYDNRPKRSAQSALEYNALQYIQDNPDVIDSIPNTEKFVDPSGNVICYYYTYNVIDDSSGTPVVTDSITILTDGTEIYFNPDDWFPDYHQDKNGNPVIKGQENDHCINTGHCFSCGANPCVSAEPKFSYQIETTGDKRLVLDYNKRPIPIVPNSFEYAVAPR